MKTRPQVRPDLVQRRRNVALVTDVARYPEFLPWCDHAAVLEPTTAA
jgi:ribosome-associated toxin RatA of RatAB toxin-antitoxin module